MGGLNPFQKYTLSMQLNIYQIELLIRILASSNPSASEEDTVMQIHGEISQALVRLKNET